MSKHTPGDWWARLAAMPGLSEVVTGDGALAYKVATCHDNDASLIASAPNLLGLLIQLRDEWFEPHYAANDIGMAVLLRDKIRAAIAKAEGR